MTVSPKDFLEKVNNKELFGFNAFGQKDQLSSTKQNVTKQEKETIAETTPNVEQTEEKGLLGKATDKVKNIAGNITTKIGTKIAKKAITEVPKATMQLEQQKQTADKYLETKVDTEAKMASVDGKYTTNYQKLQTDLADQYLGGVEGQTNMSVFKGMKDFWQSTDGTSTYLTDGTHVIKQPTLHKIDTDSLIQSAYDDVTYILANEGRLITSQELKDLYPEYADIQESSLDRFISACAYDVLEKGEKTDIQVFADYFGDISLNDNYTSEKQALLDLLSDAGFLSLGWDGLYFDEIRVYSTLSNLVNQLKELGYNVDGASDWGLLQSYKDFEYEYIDENGEKRKSTIGELLKIEESIDKKKLSKKIDEWKKRYDINISDLEVKRKNREENPQYQILLNTVGNLADYVEEYINSVNMQKMGEGKYRPLIMGNYYVGSDGSYYHPDGSIMYRLTTDESGQEIYVDEQGNKVQELSVLRGGFARSVAGLLTHGLEKSWEIPLDVSLSATAAEMGGQYENVRDMYAYQALGDVISIGFDAMMDFTVGGLGFQMLSATPGVGKVADRVFNGVINGLGGMLSGTANLMGITDGWTEEGKQELKEIGGQLLLMILGAKKEDIKSWTKEKIKSNPRLYASLEGGKAFIDEYVSGLLGKDSRTVSERIQRKKRESNMEITDKAKEEKVTEGKKVVDITPVENRVGAKISKIQAIYQEAIRSANAAYENAYIYSSVAKKGLSINEAMENYKRVVEETTQDVDPITKFEEKISEAREKVTKEVTIEQQQKQLGQELNNMAQNIAEGYKEITQTEAPKTEVKEPKTEEKTSKQIKREEVAMKEIKLTDTEQNTLKTNPLVPLLEEELFKHIKENRNKRGKITEYTQIDAPKDAEIAEALLEPLYNDVKKVLEVMGDRRKEIHDTIYATLPTLKNINLGRFWTEENLSQGGLKLSEFIANGEIGIFMDKKGKLFAKYTGGDTTQDILVEAAINSLNDALDYYNEATQNSRVALSEKNIMDIQDRINKIGYRETDGEGTKVNTDKARIGREIYRMFNDYLDKTQSAPTLRAGDKAMENIHQTLQYLEDLVKGRDEVKTNARRRLLKLTDKEIANISTLIPDIKNIIDLAQNGPQIISKITKQLLKTDFVHPLNARVAKYGTMMGVAGLIRAFVPGLLGKAAGIPAGTYLGNKVKARFKKRPITKTNKPLLDMLGLPEDVAKLMKQRKKDLDSSMASLSDRLRGLLNPEKQKTETPTEVKVTEKTIPQITTLQRQQGGTLQTQAETPLSMIGLPDNRIKFVDDFIEDFEQYVKDYDGFLAELALEIEKEYNTIKESQGEKKATEYIENVVTDVIAEVKPNDMLIDDFLSEMNKMAPEQGEGRPSFKNRSNESLSKLLDKEGNLQKGVPTEYEEEIRNEIMTRESKEGIENTADQNTIISKINKELDKVKDGKRKDIEADEFSEDIQQARNVDQYTAVDIFDDIVDGKITETDAKQKKTIYEDNEEASKWIEKRTGKSTTPTKSASKTSSLEVWNTKPDTPGKLNALKTQLETKKNKLTSVKSVKTLQKRQADIERLTKEIERLEEKLSQRELDDLDIEAYNAYYESLANEIDGIIEKPQVVSSTKVISEPKEIKADEIPTQKEIKRKGKEELEQFNQLLESHEVESYSEWEDEEGENIGVPKEVKMRNYVKDNFKSIKSHTDAVVEDRYNKKLIRTKLAFDTNIEAKDLNVVYENMKISDEVLGQFNRGNVTMRLGNRGLNFTESHEYGHYLDCKFNKELFGGEGAEGLSSAVEKADITKLDPNKKILIDEFKLIKEQIDSKVSDNMPEERFSKFSEEFVNRANGKKSKIFDESLFKQYTDWLSKMAEAREKGQLNDGTLKPSLNGMIRNMRQARTTPIEDLPQEMKDNINNMLKERGLDTGLRTYLEKVRAINASIQKNVDYKDLSEADKKAYKLKDEYIDYQIKTLDERIQDYGDAKDPNKTYGGTYARFRKGGEEFEPHISGELYDKLKEEGKIISPERYEDYVLNKREQAELSDAIQEDLKALSEMTFESVYQGGRTSYDEVNLAHVGEGEGQAVHGYGIYVAKDPAVAGRYLFSNREYKGKELSPDARNTLDGVLLRMSDDRLTYKEALDAEKKNGVNPSVIKELENISPKDIVPVGAPNGTYKGKNIFDMESEEGYVLQDIYGQAEEYANEYDMSMTRADIQQALDEYIANEYEEHSKSEVNIAKKININDFGESTPTIHEIQIPKQQKANTPTGELYLDEQGWITEDQVQKFVKAVKESGLEVGPEKGNLHGIEKTVKNYMTDKGISTENLYFILENVLGGAKEASEFLRKQGYGGIKYIGEQDGEGYVIFSPATTQVINKFNKDNRL